MSGTNGTIDKDEGSDERFDANLHSVRTTGMETESGNQSTEVDRQTMEDNESSRRMIA